MEKRVLGFEELESQSVQELPDRELMGALITVYAPVTLTLTNLLNHSFNNWRISVIRINNVDIDVKDVVTVGDINVFCNQVVAVLSAQCFGHLK
jgi:hypothetical protein